MERYRPVVKVARSGHRISVCDRGDVELVSVGERSDAPIMAKVYIQGEPRGRPSSVEPRRGTAAQRDHERWPRGC